VRNTGTLKVVAQGDRQIIMTRVFDAPRALVFEALTTPELVRQWFGPHGWSLPVCEIDLRVGGAWRYVGTTGSGRTMGMGGTYREIDPPGRLVHLEKFDDYPGEAVVETVLTETDGRTTAVFTITSSSPEARDAVIASGMEHGAAETYDRLADVLATMQKEIAR
jgi:uncharacterized protein YndB with AHSA1/START domain